MCCNFRGRGEFSAFVVSDFSHWREGGVSFANFSRYFSVLNRMPRLPLRGVLGPSLMGNLVEVTFLGR